MASRPASMRLAMAISPSRDSSSTEPISRRYMRTGSSVRSTGSARSTLATAWARGAASTISPSLSSAPSSAGPSSLFSSASSDSTTLMPMSESMASVSSICSELTSSEGITSLSSS